MDRQQLADFLRTRREALQPEDVGLSRGPRRRTHGLRREEVAALSGMSTDYYARLEQERGPQPSEQMIAAIARGLRLDLDERDHLFRLAGHNAPARALRTDHISPGLMRVLDRLADTPAQVIGGVGETLIQTPPAVALLGDQTSFTGMRRSTPYRWFTDPTSRRIYPGEDHDIHSRNYAADLRRALAREGPGSQADRIVHALLDESREFAERWARHEVARRHGEKRMQHPELGIMTLHCQLLLDEEQAQTLLVFTARPGTEDHDELALLSVIGTQQLDPESAEENGARTS